jgi:hypothetical protein
MARSMRIAVGLGLALAVLPGCATTGERRVAQGAEGSWTSCDPSPRTFYLVCVKR